MTALERTNSPAVTPLLKTSPGLDEVLRACRLRATFQNDPVFSGVRGLSTSAALGTIAHRLLEICARGEFDGVSSKSLPQAIAQKWDELAATEAQNFSELAVGQVPPPTRWPGFALKKASAIRVATRIAEGRLGAVSGPVGAVMDGSIRTQSEAWLEGQGGRLVGRVDLIRRTKAGTEVVDYKSGIVYDVDPSSDGAREIRASYVRQMLLYLSLVHEHEGNWPVKATIESLIDGPVDIEVDPGEVEKAVSEAMARLDSYNLASSRGEVVGSPTPANCRWCLYKAVCSDFLEESDHSWGGVATTIVGTLTSVIPGPPPFTEIFITGGNHPRKPVTLRGIPMPLLEALRGKEGGTISLVGIRRSTGSDDLSLNWYSQCWLWPTESATLLENQKRSAEPPRHSGHFANVDGPGVQPAPFAVQLSLSRAP